MHNVVVCIAKDEDHYIDEWLDYHFKLGFSEAYVYQNDWRYSGVFVGCDRVKLLGFDGRNTQLAAYNNFLRRHDDDIDFAAFFDVDEFMCLKPGLSLDEFLSNFTGDAGVALNWKMFGDSGLTTAPTDGDYSVIKRFTRCQPDLDVHIKTIANLKRGNHNLRFTHTPHALNVSYRSLRVKAADRLTSVRGSFNRKIRDYPAWLNHYLCKTRSEFEQFKAAKGRIEWSPDDPRQRAWFDKRWLAYNRNESEDSTALDFYTAACRHCIKDPRVV